MISGVVAAHKRLASWATEANSTYYYYLFFTNPPRNPIPIRRTIMATPVITRSAAALEEGMLPLHPHPQRHSITQLQWVLQMAHSAEPADQQKAAMELNIMIEGTTLFPLVSFAPMAHSLCRLLPSQDQTVVHYAARAVKTLLLDDALRGQALLVGLPRVLITALHTWQEEVPCLREILGALQTLSWDKHCVKSIVAPGTGPGIGRSSISTSASTSSGCDHNEAAMKENSTSTPKLDISSTEERGIADTCTPATSITTTSCALLPVLALLQACDQEVATLALAITANLCAHSDTLLLAHQDFILAVNEALPNVLQAALSCDRLLRCYGVATLANASANPFLAGRIKELGGVEVVEKIERECLRTNTVTFGGTRVSECCQVALLRLAGSSAGIDSCSKGGKKEGRTLLGMKKFKFKFGNTPALELTLDGSKNRARIVGCLMLWVVGILLVLQPVLRPN